MNELKYKMIIIYKEYKEIYLYNNYNKFSLLSYKIL